MRPYATGASAALLLTLTACRIGTDVPADELPELEVSEASDVAATLLLSTLQNSVFSTNHISFVHAHGAAVLHGHPVEGPYIHDLVVDGPLFGHHNLFFTVSPTRRKIRALATPAT
jgi:hypothetical protein